MNWMKARKILRTVWILAGLSFFVWMIISMNATGFGDEIFESDSMVIVERNDDYTSFTPASGYQKVVIFYPGLWSTPMSMPLFAGKLQRMDIKR